MSNPNLVTLRTWRSNINKANEAVKHLSTIIEQSKARQAAYNQAHPLPNKPTVK